MNTMVTGTQGIPLASIPQSYPSYRAGTYWGTPHPPCRRLLSFAFIDADQSYPLDENNDRDGNSSVDDDARPQCMTRKKTSLDPVATPINPPFEKSAAMAKEMKKNRAGWGYACMLIDHTPPPFQVRK